MMKKMFPAALVIIALIGMTACGPKSVKGKWTDDDKQRFNDEIKKVEAQLESLGEHKKAFIDCYFEKIEKNYDNFDQANTDKPGCEKLSMDCAKDIMSKMTE